VSIITLSCINIFYHKVNQKPPLKLGALNLCYLPFDPDGAAGAGAGVEDEFELLELDDGVVADPLFEELEDEEPASGVAGIGGGGAAFWVAAGALWLPLLCSADCCFEQATSAKPIVL
jgi:hypothetical protein